MYVLFFCFKIGRGGNKWLSPNGCAMFSVQLHIPFDSRLGQRLALLQHVVALSVVSAICSLPGGYDVCISFNLIEIILHFFTAFYLKCYYNFYRNLISV